MKICGIACVMNAHRITEAAIEHLMLNGIRDFFVFDHCSTPDLHSYFPNSPLSYQDVTVRVLRKETIEFYQGPMINALAKIAQKEGFDIAVPFDSDEFWCSTVPDMRLADELLAEFAQEIDVLRLPVINYLQSFDIKEFSIESMQECRYAVIPPSDVSRFSKDMKRANLPFVAMPFRPKVAIRLRPEVKLAEGQHKVLAPDGAVRIVDARGMVVRHLPIFSEEQVFQRKVHGQRRIAAGYKRNVGRQEQVLVEKSDEELHAYWRDNSWSLGENHHPVVGTYKKLVEDDSLVAIAKNIIAARESVENIGISAQEGRKGIITDIAINAMEALTSELIDEVGRSERYIEKLETDLRKVTAPRRRISVLHGRLRTSLHHLLPWLPAAKD